jgi:hypothetical protein
MMATPVGGPGIMATDGEESYHAGGGSAVRLHIPAPPPDGVYEQQAPQFFGRERVEVPGAVAVNVPPYVCDVDGKTFSTKKDFVAHLQTSHGKLLRQIDDPFTVHRGQVHFRGK